MVFVHLEPKYKIYCIRVCTYIFWGYIFTDAFHFVIAVLYVDGWLDSLPLPH